MKLLILPNNAKNRDSQVIQYCTSCKLIQTDTIRSHSRLVNCKFCDDSRKIYTHYDISKRIESQTNAKFELLDDIQYINSTSKIKILHKCCGNIFTTQFQQFRNKKYQTCQLCQNKKQWDTQSLSNKLTGFSILTEVAGSQSRIDIKCNICQVVRNIVAKNQLKYICSTCKGIKQKGEYTINNYLIKNKIDFTQQFKIDNKFCDFKIGNIILEYDGDQHYCDQWLNNDGEDLSKRYERDREKDSKIIESNMKVLRIDYTITDEVLEYVLDHIFQINECDMPISSQVSIKDRQRFNDYRNHAETQKRVGYTSTEVEMGSTLKFKGKDIVWSYTKV